MATKKTKKQTTKQTAPVENMRPAAGLANAIYNRGAPILLGEGILFAVAAVLLLLKPIAILTAITFVLGVALMLLGLYRTIAGFVASHQVGGGGLDVVFGIVNIILGLLFCIYPAGSMISLMYIFLVMFAFKALGALVFAIRMARARFGHYVLDLIMALILVGLTVALLFWPVAGIVAMVYYLAVTLLMYAIADLYMFVKLRRFRNRMVA